VADIRFRARIAIVGVNPYVPVSAARASRIKPGWRKPMPVLVRVNDGAETWRTNLMPVGDGGFRLYLHGGMRRASGSQVDDSVTVALAFDCDYKRGPADPMQAWFATALAKNPAAQRGWKALTPSQQKELLRYFARLQSDSAQRRNAERAVQVLAGGEGRFMGRAWNTKTQPRVVEQG
jgi:Domain of unknown function (DUF1905)/Bacteriocin-protection, YdeI or OmpD-Associated